MALGDNDPDYQPAEDEDALSSYNSDEEEDKFDVKDYDDTEHVVFAVNQKCQTLYRNSCHKMKRRYQQLVKAGKNPYNTPYRGVTWEDWAWIIDNISTNKDKEAQLEANRQEVKVLGSTTTMPQEEMAVEVDLDG
ncbi:hypothetical protein Vadar_020377 [Vaccinium darrowii]|uniref:Uncharacterized protein n=1 Tax=Vaccinium darrowii TaxID=229202 RepID=A0ACB7ZKP2_9ERIC|nr:hypothetical protein Vadar_020377 [Vaccinium darrowii]